MFSKYIQFLLESVQELDVFTVYKCTSQIDA